MGRRGGTRRSNQLSIDAQYSFTRNPHVENGPEHVLVSGISTVEPIQFADHLIGIARRGYVAKHLVIFTEEIWAPAFEQPGNWKRMSEKALGEHFAFKIFCADSRVFGEKLPELCIHLAGSISASLWGGVDKKFKLLNACWTRPGRVAGALAGWSSQKVALGTCTEWFLWESSPAEPFE